MLTLYILNQLNHLLDFKPTDGSIYYHMKEFDNFATKSITLVKTNMHILSRKHF